MSEVVEEPIPARGSRAATAGFVFALLFVVGWVFVHRSPDILANDADLAEFFSNPSRRRAAFAMGLYFLPFAGLAFIWFAAAFRHRVVTVSGGENALFSAVYTVAAALFAASLFLIGTVELALAWTMESGEADVDSLRSLSAFGLAMSQLFALRTGSLYMTVSTTRALRSGVFPRWFAVISYVAALALMLVATTWRPVVLAIPIWVAAASAMVLMRQPEHADEPA